MTSSKNISLISSELYYAMRLLFFISLDPESATLIIRTIKVEPWKSEPKSFSAIVYEIRLSAEF